MRILVGFFSIGDLFYSERWGWDLRTLAQSQESEMSSGLFQDLSDAYLHTWLILVILNILININQSSPILSNTFHI